MKKDLFASQGLKKTDRILFYKGEFLCPPLASCFLLLTSYIINSESYIAHPPSQLISCFFSVIVFSVLMLKFISKPMSTTIEFKKIMIMTTMMVPMEP